MAYDSYLTWKKGDVIQFQCRGSGEMLEMEIVSVCLYVNILHMLRAKTVTACLPHVRMGDVQAGVREYENMLSMDDLRKYGVIAMTFRPRENE